MEEMKKKDQEQRLKLFLNDLNKLTNGYGISIGGCGCCGSPWLKDLEYQEYLCDYLEFNEFKKVYVIKGGE